MAFGSQEQSDFGGGVYRGRKAPDNAVYDLVNGLLDDEGQPFRRGGSAYVTTSDAGSALLALKSSYYPIPAALRTLAFSATQHYAVSGTGFVALGTFAGPYPPPAGCRVTAAAQVTIWPFAAAAGSGYTILTIAYGGSLKAAAYSSGTVTATSGSATVTGSATSWLANLDAGMFFNANGQTGGFRLIKSVDSNTQITLDQPWAGATGSGKSYQGYPVIPVTDVSTPLQAIASSNARPYVAWVGRRVLVAYGTRVAFGPLDNPLVQNATDYHEMPGDAFITGLDGLGDTAYVFTTEGVWAISNLFLSPVDAYGNIQHSVQRINKDLILWGDAGIAAWAGGFVVPGIDDVHVMLPDGSATPVSAAIRPLYRSYVAAGYQPGLATVHRGHYFLPILNGATVVDTLVCRLDRNASWTRWAGHAAAVGFATQVGASTRSPRLLAIQGQRVLELTACFDPSSENVFDADGTMFDTVITTRDYPTGQQPGFFKKARVRYELVSSGFSGDDFERPDENPVAGGWLAWAGTRPKIVDGVCVPVDANYAYTAWNEAIGPDCTVTALFQAALNVGDSIGLGLRLTAHSSSADGYTMETYNVGAGPVLNLYEGASFSQIGTAVSIPAGDIDGASLSMTGTTLFCLLRIDGVWTGVLTLTGQATFPDAGYPGFWVFGANGVQSVTWSGDGVDPRPVQMAFSSAADGDVFTNLTDTGAQGGGTGWRSSDGGLYQWATVGRKRERGRLRITVPAGPASFVLRSLELLTRGSGKQ